jgi:hypothetical protein
MKELRTVEECLPINVIEPDDYSGTATVSDYISLKNYGRVTFYIQTGDWAGGDAAVTLTEATAQAGTGAQALALTTYWKKASASELLEVQTATSNTFNVDSADTLYVVEVDEDDLSVNDDYCYVQLNIASPGQNSDKYGVLAICDNAQLCTTPDKMRKAII